MDHLTNQSSIDTDVTRDPQQIEALERLVYVGQRGGLGALRGPKGSGKSKILKSAAQELRGQGRRVLWIDSTGMTPREFLQALSDILGIGLGFVACETELRLRIRDHVTSCQEANGPLVFIVDHADQGSKKIVDDVRWLLGLLTGSSALLASVGRNCSKPWRRFIADHSLLRIELGRLSEEAVHELIHQQIPDCELTRDALAEIVASAQGRMHRLRQLLDLAMLAGSEDGETLDSVSWKTLSQELSPSRKRA
ncbi:MAG: ATP-binding protein [Planctomycetaceae bacterium]|nr:ATP-binding protein [Planctomycetaceae bacterium]